MPIDFWLLLLITTFLFGIMGWFMIPITSCLIWYCEWKDGNPIDWGNNIGYAVATPFVWLFAIFEIYLLYMK